MVEFQTQLSKRCFIGLILEKGVKLLSRTTTFYIGYHRSFYNAGAFNRLMIHLSKRGFIGLNVLEG